MFIIHTVNALFIICCRLDCVGLSQILIPTPLNLDNILCVLQYQWFVSLVNEIGALGLYEADSPYAMTLILLKMHGTLHDLSTPADSSLTSRNPAELNCTRTPNYRPSDPRRSYHYWQYRNAVLSRCGAVHMYIPSTEPLTRQQRLIPEARLNYTRRRYLVARPMQETSPEH